VESCTKKSNIPYFLSKNKKYRFLSPFWGNGPRKDGAVVRPMGF
jgi:hypothetical protein